MYNGTFCCKILIYNNRRHTQNRITHPSCRLFNIVLTLTKQILSLTQTHPDLSE